MHFSASEPQRLWAAKHTSGPAATRTTGSTSAGRGWRTRVGAPTTNITRFMNAGARRAFDRRVVPSGSVGCQEAPQRTRRRVDFTSLWAGARNSFSTLRPVPACAGVVMNPLTQIKNTQKASLLEARRSASASAVCAKQLTRKL